MRCIVDTSAYSALRRDNQKVISYLDRAESIFVNPIVAGELRAGFLSGRWQGKNEGELLQFLLEPSVDYLPIDDETAVRYSYIKHYLREHGTPIPSNDLWIAATAHQHGLRLLTLDRHFTRLPQIIVDFIEPTRP